jgi:endoglucanase
MPLPQPAGTTDGRARREHERWLLEVTSLPTAAGREDAVVAWIDRWVAARRHLRMRRDRAGNLLITRVRQRRATAAGRALAPLFITAHLDHPAFVVVGVRRGEVVLEFRGGVHDPYFEDARIEIRDRSGAVHHAGIMSLDSTAQPFKRVIAQVAGATNGIAAGDLARWRFDGTDVPRVAGGTLHTHACDDLAGVVAALATMDALGDSREAGHVGLLFTRAEEVGFVGAIAACRAKFVSIRARLICLETSRSFAESPIGGGPIVRIGDRTSVFDRDLTNAVSGLMTEHERTHPGFRWQRKLMPGGTCEATTFGAYGYRSTCLCLPLGNYHNMVDIDGVVAGRRPAIVGPEFINLADFHGLVEMLVVCAMRLDTGVPSLRARMEGFMSAYGHVLQPTAPTRPTRRTRERGPRRAGVR